MLTTTEILDGVAVIRIDNPPINAGNAAQRAALLTAIERAAAQPHVTGIVIASAGRHFYAGSDLREFDAPLADPSLPDVIAAIEGARVPVAAAITGLALGGGLELALACDRRIMGQSSRVGFPEVGFGILPGAGGTVRAARLIGVPAAIDLVTSARQLEAAEARSLGLVDDVVPDEELIAAASRAVQTLPGRDLVRDRATAKTPADEVERALAAIPARARPNVRLAAQTVIRGADLDVQSALDEERNLFDQLRLTAESADLRYAFFARQVASKDLRSTAEPRRVRTIGVVGAGTMGAALSRLFDASGYDVVVVDTEPAALAHVRTDHPRIRTDSDLEALIEADLVIDAVFEDMAVKQSLLSDLDPILRPDAVIATNTSYLDVNGMSSALVDASRFGGLHFFNPADRNPLVEVIPADATSEVTLATLGSVITRLGKCGIRAGVGDGFVGNRVYADYRLQAEFLVEEGATPHEVDRAMTDLGFAIGPFAVADMSGLDIAWARRKRLALTRNSEERYVSLADRLCEAGRLGRKSGAGWYDYPGGARRGQPSPAVAEVIEKARASRGIRPKHFPATTVQHRILGSMLAAAVEVVRCGVANRASDVDVALVEGFAFPRHLGGPLRTLSRMSERDLIAAMTAVHESDPVHFAVFSHARRGEVPAPVRQLLADVNAISPITEHQAVALGHGATQTTYGTATDGPQSYNS